MPTSGSEHYDYPSRLQINQQQYAYEGNYDQTYQENEHEQEEGNTFTSDSTASRDAIHRFSEGELPWSPLSGAKRPRSDTTQDQYPPDRSYPDKLQVDLNEMQKDAGDQHEDGSPQKKKRRSRAKGHGRTRATARKDRHRDHDEDGHGDGSVAT